MATKTISLILIFILTFLTSINIINNDSAVSEAKRIDKYYDEVIRINKEDNNGLSHNLDRKYEELLIKMDSSYTELLAIENETRIIEDTLNHIKEFHISGKKTILQKLKQLIIKDSTNSDTLKIK